MNTEPRRFVDHITLLFRWRWMILGVVFCSAVLTFVISSLVPKTYRASAVVLPPFEGGAALPFMVGINVDVFGVNEVPVSSMATLLKSRALKDRVNKRINLMEHYKKPNVERAYEAFESHLEVEFESEEGFATVKIISFKVHILDHDPQFCAELLNVVVEEWDRLCVELNRRGATLRREFVEESIHKTSRELAAYEDSLRVFQEEHGIAAIDVQLQGTIASAVALEQKIAEARINAEVLGKLYERNHPLLQRANLELQGLLQERAHLQTAAQSDGLLLSMGAAPEVGLVYYRLFREVKIYEAVYQVLMQQYEQAKIQELKDTPALRIVDRAEVPLYKYAPRRLLLTLIAALSAFFLAIVAVYSFNYLDRTRGTEESRWIADILDFLKADLDRARRLIGKGRK